MTVLSRCLQFNLRQMASTTINEHLQNVLGQENIAFEPAAISLISRAAAGSMRDALSLTDQAIAYGNQTVNEAEVRSMLGAIDQSYLHEILHALQANNGAAIIEKAQNMQMRNISFEAALNDLAIILHQIAMAQTVPDSFANDLPERAILLDLAAKLPPETLQLYYQIALLGRRDIGLAPDEYAGFTMTLLRMLAFAPQDGDKQTKPIQAAAKPAIQNAMQTQVAQPITKPETMQTALQQATITHAPVPVLTQEPEINNTDIKTDATDANIHAASGLLDTDSILFDGDWRKLVEQNLKLGLARALAQNCELLDYDENSLNLRVASNQKHLVSASYQDKLSSAINEYFGRKIRLNIDVVSESSAEIVTPAKQNASEKAVIQSGAEAAIMSDPFVQDLMQKFGAQIIPNSIKPN